MRGWILQSGPPSEEEGGYNGEVLPATAEILSGALACADPGSIHPGASFLPRSFGNAAIGSAVCLGPSSPGGLVPELGAVGSLGPPHQSVDWLRPGIAKDRRHSRSHWGFKAAGTMTRPGRRRQGAVPGGPGAGTARRTAPASPRRPATRWTSDTSSPGAGSWASTAVVAAAQPSGAACSDTASAASPAEATPASGPTGGQAAPEDVRDLFSRLRVRPTEDGGIAIEAPPEAASSLAALFEKMLRAGAVSATGG